MKKILFILARGSLLAVIILFFSATPVLADCVLLGCADWGEPSCSCDDDPFWPCTKVTCGGSTCCVYDCTPGSCGCFTGKVGAGIKGTEGTEETYETKEIKELQPGDVVSSFNPETGEVSEGTVSDIQKLTREGYYVLETESGKKVRVTGEHPFLAVKSEKNQSAINNQQLLDKVKDFLSHTLAYQFLATLQAKLSSLTP